MWSDPNKEVNYKNIDINLSKLICLKIKLFRFVLKAINLLEVHSSNLFSSPGPKISVCYCNHFGSVSFSHMALYENIKKLIYCEPFDTKSGWNVLSKWLFFCLFGCCIWWFFFVKSKSKMAPTAEQYEKINIF